MQQIISFTISNIYYPIDWGIRSLDQAINPVLEKIRTRIADILRIRQETATEGLLSAVQRRDIKACERYCKLGANVNAKTEAGLTPLASALLHGDLDLSKLLIKYGADVNNTDSYGEPLLFGMLALKNMALCQILLENGANPNAKTSSGNTVLISAILTLNYSQLNAFANQAKISHYNLFYNTVKENNGLACLSLARLGFILNEEEQKQLALEMIAAQWPSHTVPFLFLKKPLPKTIEIFNGTKFETLTSDNATLNHKPLCIINNADFDHVPSLPYFGAITRYYDLSQSRDFYKKIAENYRVVRILVDDTQDLIPLMEQVKTLTKNAKVAHWMLNGHGNETVLALGISSRLTIDNTALMGAIAESCDEDTIITLCGCNNGGGKKNLASTFSSLSNKRIVVAAPTLVDVIQPRKIFSSSLMLPSFGNDGSSSSRIYRDGDLILDETPLPSKL